MVDFAYKIQIPQRPSYVVSRPRLNELLNSIIERRLITICAPPGYGKTSLLVDFANSAPLPVCWYTLDSSDQDPWLFLEYLVASVENRFVEAARQTRLMLSGYSHTAFMSVVSSFARDIYQIAHDFAVILDDWHLIDSVPEIREAVGLLLTRCPNCKIILASRTYPSLPSLMLLAARRQMLGFDERQMRFTNEEVSDVLDSELESEFTREQIDALTEQSNGWITGILLLLQTGDRSLSEAMPTRVGAERQVYQFLAEQVFDQQDPDIQQFLLHTSLLEELTAKICNTILKRNNSAKLLKTLINCHMFISEIKDGVFRYHPLFREFLHEHFQVVNPEQYHETVLLIADMYSSERQWLQAFDMYVAIGHYEKAQQIVLSGGEHLYALGRLETLESWFQTLPTDNLAVPLMGLQARVAMDRGDIHKAKTLAQQAALHMRPEDEPMVLLLQAQIARVLGDYQDILAYAERILVITDDLGLRSSALRIMGVYYQRQGHVMRGIGKLEEALCIEQQHGDLNAIAKIQHELGIAYKTIGLFSIAEQYYANVEAYCTTVGNVGLRALSLNSKGIMQYLMGRYYEAHQSLTTALQDARASAVPPYQAAVLSSLGDLYASLQLWERARVIYNDARAMGGTATIRSDLDLAQVWILIGQHQYQEAAQTLLDLPRVTTVSRSNQVLLLEGIIACGLKQYLHAQEVVQRMLALFEPAGDSMDLALAYMLQAEIAARAQSDRAPAMLRPLEQAAVVADKLGHSTFLISAMLRIPDVLRRAASTGWPRAQTWLRQQQDLIQIAQALDVGTKRNTLQVHALGVEDIILNQKVITIGWNKAREAFFYLLAHPNGSSIDELRENIWPDLSDQRSREALRTAIYQIRSVFPRDFIVLHGRQVYKIDRNVINIDYDVEAFVSLQESAEKDPQALIAAINLYQGPFLPSSENQWSTVFRSHLEQQYVHTLHSAAKNHEVDRHFTEALLLYKRILTVENFDEVAHTGIMRCQIALGNRAAAIEQYHMLRQLLDEELGLNPKPASELEQLYLQMLADA